MSARQRIVRTAHFVPLTSELLAIAIAEAADPTLRAHMPPPAIGPGWAMIEGAALYGAGGVFPIWPGRALAWLMPSVSAGPREIAMAASFARDWFGRLQADPAFARVEATTRGDFAGGRNFLERLGFTCECEKMARWGPDGADHTLWSRIRED